MTANTSPISPIASATSWPTTPLLTANTALDGTGTVGLAFTAGANGAKINRLIITHLGTNIATVLRFFLNNGSTNTTAANNQLVAETTVASNTLSQVAQSVQVQVALNITIPAGYKINYTTGTTVASGFAIVADGGNY